MSKSAKKESQENEPHLEAASGKVDLIEQAYFIAQDELE